MTTEFHLEQGGCSVIDVGPKGKLIAAAGTGLRPSSPARVVKLYTTEKRNDTHEICRLAFETPVLGLKIKSYPNKEKRLFVIVETKIHIFDLKKLEEIQTILMIQNPKGLFSLGGPNSEWISYVENNSVNLHNVLTNKSLKYSTTHSQVLDALKLHTNGEYAATMSEGGQIIQVVTFDDVMSSPNPKPMLFSRSVAISARCLSIAFSETQAPLLAIASSRGTIHMFLIEKEIR
eukprot:TRINITY_DN2790_c0_g1_i1.p1 TRINITY_DN2790_c0_g1~~TRINITY_DN2790_c0_g1_i1.p1  ORF type:complete len:269 (+),score=27.00 TRINITY_DN2790_c0_g1_i1:111-809(+)